MEQRILEMGKLVKLSNFLHLHKFSSIGRNLMLISQLKQFLKNSFLRLKTETRLSILLTFIQVLRVILVACKIMQSPHSLRSRGDGHSSFGLWKIISTVWSRGLIPACCPVSRWPWLESHGKSPLLWKLAFCLAEVLPLHKK